jgi:hypothetical protein
MSLVAMKHVEGTAARARDGLDGRVADRRPGSGQAPSIAIPPLISWAIRRTASKSPGEAAGKPASITSTFRRAS